MTWPKDDIKALRARAEASPGRVKLWNRLARALAAAGDDAGAQCAWDRAIAADGDHAEAHAALAELLTSAGRLDDAIAHLRTATESIPLDLGVRARLAELLEAARDAAGAATAHRTAGIVAAELEARSHLNSMGFTPDNHLAPYQYGDRFGRAIARLRQGETEAAATLFQDLAGRHPQHAAAWVGLRAARDAAGSGGGAATVSDDWARAAPGDDATRSLAMNRPLSASGLPFDPRERFPLARKEDVLPRFAASAELQAEGPGYLVLDPGGELIARDTVIRLEPDGRDDIPVRTRTTESFVVALNGAAVVGRGAVIGQDGVVLRDLLKNDLDKIDARIEGDELTFDRDRFLDGACDVRYFETPALLMAGPTDLSFGDWITNFPPRLALAAAAGLDCPILVSRRLPAKFIEMLLALGVDRRRLLFHNPDGVSILPRLYVPSWPLPDRARPMKGLFDVYTPLAAAAAAVGDARIYLSRRGVGARAMRNEDEVRALFASRGFRILHPEALDLAGTLEAFAGATCVAGPYGSAFRNMVFCAMPPAAFEIMPPYPDSFLPGVAIWQAMLGVKFAYVRGAKAGRGGESSANLAAWSAPIEVLAPALDRFLALIGADGAASIASPIDDKIFELRVRAEIPPQKCKPWKRLAAALLADEDLVGAGDAWRRALALDPHDAEAQQGLGRVAYRTGRLEDAITHFGAAAHVRPGDVTPRILLARTYERAANPEAAARAWAVVLELDPSHAEGRERLDGLLRALKHGSSRHGG